MTHSKERRRERATLIKFSVFIAVSLAFTLWVAVVTSKYQATDREPYRAVFEDISGLAVGDDVRIAGVDVGRVNEIDVQPDNTVVVEFDVRSDQRLTSATTATVQYRNLIGDRILQLAPGEKNAPAALPVGSTLPVDQTFSALNIDTLLNGFRPLFRGLSPREINQLSGQLIGVLQGQHSAVATLFEHIASVTTTLGDRQEVIGAVIENLNSVLGTLDESSGSLGELIDRLDALMRGLNKQDTELLDAAAEVDRFAGRTADLLKSARPDIETDLQQLLVAARGINTKSATLEELLQTLPHHYRTLQNSASYGNFFNFFLCGSRVHTDAGYGQWNVSEAARCQR